jgi:GDP-L-fucose synthase
MPSILITGGSGLVGNAIRNISHEYPNYECIYISSKDYDLTKMDETIDMFKKYNPTYVIHLAACVGGLYKNMNNKVEMFEKNVSINYNVVKCSHDFKVKKLIACLSTCIFPDKVTYPIVENQLHDGPPHSSNDAYAYAKRMLEVQCKAYRENYNDNFVCVIPTNIYGKHDNFDLEDGHVIPSLIHKCYLAKQQNVDFIIRGSGKPLRQFIYSEDLAKLILWVLENYNENIILSTHERDEISIENVGRLISRAYDYEDRIVFDENYSDGQYKKTVSTQNLMSNIPDFIFTAIEEGIETTVKWFVTNHL